MSGTTNYDFDQSVTVSAVALSTVTAVVAPDGSTPAGELPTVSLAVDLSLLGTVDVVAENGGVADITNVIGVLGAMNVTANDGTVNLEPAGLGALSGTNILIENGGTVTASGTFLGVLDGSSITFGTGGGTLNFNSDGTLINLDITAPITGFGASDVIDDQDLTPASIGSYNITNGFLSTDQVVTFYSGPNGTGSTVGSLTFAPGTFTGFTPGTNYNSGNGPIQLGAGPGGGVALTTCFLSGTHIAIAAAAPEGVEIGEIRERRVEDLRVGDRVATLRDGVVAFEPVIWIGSRSVVASRLAADEAFPVRIRAGAFAEHMPARDLLVTPDHCVFTHGRLVPARMLVNGGSVVIDRNISSYSYYHVELARHAVLLAEGLPAESYLDTGNRGNFANAPVPALRPDFACQASHEAWRDRAAAPLGVARDFVEPIWRGLAERAAMLGMAPNMPEVTLTDHADLHLVAENGLEIRPVLAEGDTYSFLIPGGARNLRLVSRTARPSEMIGPFVDDRRALGVLVGRIDLGIGRSRLAVEAHLSGGKLAGWHAPEAGVPARWTGGEALLPLDLAGYHGRPVFLDVQVLQAGPYAAVAADQDVPPVAAAA